MSSLAPIGSQPPVEVSGIMPTTSASAPPAPYLQGTLDGVANMLGMSTDNLRSALKQGSSISDVAAQKGVSTNSIVSYIEQQVQQKRASKGLAPVNQQALDQVVSRAVTRHRRGHHQQVDPSTDPASSTAPPTAAAARSASQSLLDLLA